MLFLSDKYTWKLRKMKYKQNAPVKNIQTTSRLQEFIISFLKNIFLSVLAPQIAVASLGGPRMVQKEYNCN